MALPVLNPGIANLSQDSAIYDLYTRYYNNMVAANDVDTPSFDPLPSEIEANGDLTQEYYDRVNAGLASYSEIQMRNAAYNSAVAVFSSLGGGSGGGSGSTSGFLARAGDSMLGLLQARYGFEAGFDNVKIFDTTIVDNVNTAHVYGTLIVDSDAEVTGKIVVGDDGIYFGNDQTLYKDDSTGDIVLAGTNIVLDGAVESTGSITVGDVVVGQSSITNNGHVYYHAGNANNQYVDWASDDMEVFGDLTVHGDQSFGGMLSALNGFELGADNTVMFQSVVVESNGVITDKWLNLKSMIDLEGGAGLSYNGHPILKAYRDANNNNEYRVDFGAPGMNMYLGASDGNMLTTKVFLASDIWNYANTFRIVSRFGDGNFPNSLSAGCATSGPTVLQTYFGSQSDCGVVFQKLIRLNSVNGPSLSIGASEYEAKIDLPYQHVVNDMNTLERLPIVFSFEPTTSLFADRSLSWSASLGIDLDDENAEFFSFRKPVEAEFFSIIGEQYKTKLGENVLFFDDGVFLEGIVGGIYHSGNGTFSGSISSPTFASGFAGYGWAVKPDQLYGGYEATFDSLVVRKKMRVYELEVQKISATNGSLWVSDSCSGDTVTEIV
jgi:hypothetical protein